LWTSPVINFSTGSFTVSSWFVTTWVLTTDNDAYTIILKDTGWLWNVWRWLSLRGASSYKGLLFRVGTPDAWAPGWSRIYDAIPTGDIRNTINNGTWHQAVWVFDRTAQNMYLYLDGTLVGNKSIATLTGSLWSAWLNWYIGINTPWSIFQFDGWLDDIRTYNRALSAQEVKNLYIATNQYANGDCTDTNGAVHPIATEVCDGIDNDCDRIDLYVLWTYRSQYSTNRMWSTLGCLYGNQW
jgi:hypothetical protein